jgi:hypothetical protein
MRNSKKGNHLAGRRAALLFAVTLALVMVAPVSAADNGSVPGQVSVVGGGACIEVAGVFTFGLQPFSPDGAIGPTLSSTGATITNCDATAPADILARGTAAVSSTDAEVVWDLNTTIASDGCPTVGTDQYGHAVFSVQTGLGIFLSLVDTPTFGDQLASGATYDIVPQLYMPCEGSGGAGHTMNFSAIFTALQG